MPRHVVVDGSNIATEGRPMPSLQQLNEAVTAYIKENPDALITVVVDATFGHRINSSEVAEFDDAVANNELVAPPAGAVGRGDAFVLSIANKVGATILSNDSFQEFHGTHPWLFDEGRLIGGKPVPHIGWVFVPRLPVRGPISRSSVKEARRKKQGGASPKDSRRQASAEASQPMPVPKAPPPKATLQPKAAAPAAAATAQPKQSPASTVNDFLSFLSFVEHHPVGTSVNATVESYSSHGAYVRLENNVVGYVPLRLMADPPPRSAREYMKVGDAVTLVVESFAPARRSIDLAVVGMATAKPPKAGKAEAAEKATKTPSRRKKAAAPVEEPPAPTEPPAKKRGTRKKAAATAPELPLEPSPPATGSAPAPAKRSRKKAAATGTVSAPGPAPAAKRTRAKASPKADTGSEPAPAKVKKSATRRRSGGRTSGAAAGG